MRFTITKELKNKHLAILFKDIKDINNFSFNKDEISYINNEYKDDNQINIITIDKLSKVYYICIVNDKKNFNYLEGWRKVGDKIQTKVCNDKQTELGIESYTKDANIEYAFLEGAILGTYSFDKYLTKKATKLDHIYLNNNKLTKTQLTNLNNICDAIYFTRDLINEPANALDSVSLAKKFEEMGKDANLEVEVFDKKKIESLKFGGLLAVNQGSVTPATFTIITHKPKDAINKKPFVFVGKGITFDSGGMNLKPGNYMNDMKSDMSGGAIVGGLMYAIAKNKLPIYTIGLIPATDNRVNGNAMISGDIITMFNKKTVEISNTDAEGRLILADALSFADKYKPELVIDLATLTGAASRAIGHFGIVAMGTADDESFNLLKQCGEETYERIVEFPFWHEYESLIKSKVADVDNSGTGGFGGAITAGKFLSNFVESDFIHLDIAGPAFVNKRFNYNGVGGTGIGIRLLYNFLQKKITLNNK